MHCNGLLTVWLGVALSRPRCALQGWSTPRGLTIGALVHELCAVSSSTCYANSVRILGPNSIEKILHWKSHREWHRKRHPKLHLFLLLKKFLKWVFKIGFGAIFGVIFGAILFYWIEPLPARAELGRTARHFIIMAKNGLQGSSTLYLFYLRNTLHVTPTAAAAVPHFAMNYAIIPPAAKLAHVSIAYL